jgi:hypothetical protein
VSLEGERKGRGRKVFFSEEKKQKTLQLGRVVPLAADTSLMNKSLLLLFFRKEDLPSLLLPLQ